MNCKSLRLTEIPQFIPQNTTTLILTNNLLTVIRNDTFASASSLKCLDVSNNDITTLQPKAFSGLTNLKQLLLSSNKLIYDYSSFPVDVFVPLGSLEVLDLIGNRFDKPSPYPDIAFSHLVKLRELHLDSFYNISLGKGFAKLTNLKLLNFYASTCKLSKLMNSTFIHLQNSSLSVLDLENCNIRHIESSSFLPLKHLSVLNMKWNKYLPIKDAMTSLYGLQGRNMSLIDFTRVFNPGLYPYNEFGRFAVLTKDIAKYLSRICVRKLSLQHNQLYYLEMSALQGVPFSHCIEELDISKNNIHMDYLYYMNWGMFPKLKRLDISNQRFSVSDVDTLAVIPPVLYVEFPPKLQYFNMGALIANTKISFSINVLNGNFLQYFNLSFNGIKGFNFHIIGIPNITTLDISNNYAVPFAINFLHNFSKLVHLSMNNMNFDYEFFYHNVRTIFSKCSSLESINLAHNKFTALPPDSFNDLKNLNFLDLSYNSFVSLTDFLFNVPTLQHIDFSYNSLTSISTDDINKIESKGNNFSLSLKGNPISCTCNSLAFISWLCTTKVKLDNDHNYICINMDGQPTSTLAFHHNYRRHWINCISHIVFTIAFTFLSLIVIFFFCSLLIVNNWTRIQHKLLRLLGNHYRLLRRHDFRFALNVVNCDNDRTFVHTTLYQTLEVENGIRLYLQEREILIHSVPEGIIDGINTSWKTLLIVTKDFLRDPWSFLTIKTCVYAVSEAIPRRVILLIVGDTSAADIPEELLNVVHEEDILTIATTEESGAALMKIKDLVTNDLE